jgi:biopolymer transport protein ExbB
MIGSGGLGAVSAGIAEALVETALGLMVAIPAVLFFNQLNTKINAVETELARRTGELLDEVENAHGSRDSGSFEKVAA